MERASSRRCVLSVDLEGFFQGCNPSLSLLQISTFHDGAQEQLTYIFDVFADPSALHARGERTLRALLEDESVIKVFHSGHNDFRVLFYGYGITVRGAFDTSIADAVLRGKHHNSSRGLASVLQDWVGNEAHLPLKGSVEFDLIFQRPLSYKFYCYSYQDVLYGAAAFFRMTEHLKSMHAEELVLELSSNRALCATQLVRSARQTHAKHSPTALIIRRVVIALMDSNSIICLRTNDGTLSLPTLDVTNRLVESASADYSKTP